MIPLLSSSQVWDICCNLSPFLARLNKSVFSTRPHLGPPWLFGWHPLVSRGPCRRWSEIHSGRILKDIILAEKFAMIDLSRLLAFVMGKTFKLKLFKTLFQNCLMKLHCPNHTVDAFAPAINPVLLTLEHRYGQLFRSSQLGQRSFSLLNPCRGILGPLGPLGPLGGWARISDKTTHLPDST